jgi:hypothetical protein
MVGETLVCPNCGEDIRPGSRFCGNCFREVRICEACGSVLLHNVVFCQKCGTAVPPIYESPASGPAHSQPYMVWEGWPFAWLQTVTQTRRQWRVTLAISIISFAFLTLMVALVIVHAPADDVCCLSGILIGEIAFVAMMFALRYKSGRLGAQDLERRRDSERY